MTSSSVPLLSGSNWGNNVAVEGFKAGPDTDTNSRYNEVGTGLLLARWASRCLPGATSRAATASTAPKVAIVNEAFAKKFNLGRDAVGKRMGTTAARSALTIEIVGLVQQREVQPR